MNLLQFVFIHFLTSLCCFVFLRGWLLISFLCWCWHSSRWSTEKSKRTDEYVLLPRLFTATLPLLLSELHFPRSPTPWKCVEFPSSRRPIARTSETKILNFDKSAHCPACGLLIATFNHLGATAISVLSNGLETKGL